MTSGHFFNWIFVQSDDINDVFLQCAKAGDTGKMWALLTKGVDVNVVDQTSGLSALHYAVIHGHLETVKMLLIQPDIELLNMNKLNQSGRTPLHFAIIYERLDHAKTLYLHQNMLLDVKDRSQKTCMHMACLNNGQELIRWLLAKGVNTAIMDEKKRTPLMWAITLDSSENAMRLIENGVDVNEPPNHVAAYGPLRTAIEYNKLDIVYLLIQRGAELDFTIPASFEYAGPNNNTIRDSCEFECQNLATIALRNVDISVAQSLEIAHLALISSVSPPTVESIFEFYGRYMLKSWKGQRVKVRRQMRSGLYSYMIPSTKAKLMTLLCIAIAGSSEKISDKRTLKNRFMFPASVFNQLVTIYEKISLKRTSAISLRNQQRTLGYRNMMEAVMLGKDLQASRPLINMSWAYLTYSDLLQQP